MSHCSCTNSSQSRLAFLSCESSPMDNGFQQMIVAGINSAISGRTDTCLDVVRTNPLSCDAVLFATAVDVFSNYSFLFGSGFNVQDQACAVAT
eukprot:4061071-Prymnesium_polylepis.2